MPEITLKKASRIVELHRSLAEVRVTLKQLNGVHRIRIYADYREGAGYEARNGEVRFDGSIGSNHLAGSILSGMRQAWRLREASIIRELRQLDAEVPNG